MSAEDVTVTEITHEEIAQQLQEIADKYPADYERMIAERNRPTWCHFKCFIAETWRWSDAGKAMRQADTLMWLAGS